MGFNPKLENLEDLYTDPESQRKCRPPKRLDTPYTLITPRTPNLTLNPKPCKESYPAQRKILLGGSRNSVSRAINKYLDWG